METSSEWQEEASWRALVSHRNNLRSKTLTQLFADDPGRFDSLSFAGECLFVDLSKQHWTPAVVASLLDLARARGLEAWREALFRGERVNVTEERAALHSALRQPGDEPLQVGGRDVTADVRAAQARIRDVAAAVREQRWPGTTGAAVRAVVNIGIGGSDLGPLMACDALHVAGEDRVDVRFASNVDPAHLDRALEGLDPATTLFVVTSKTFTTLETMTNARAAREWLLARLGAGADVSAHMLAVTANPRLAVEFGVGADNVLPFWDWVGGRFSLWSAVGLPIAIAAGWDRFARLLAGAASMDSHFRTADPAANLPVLLALSTVWNADFCDARQTVIAPYAQSLARFPAYVQQLSMESNGKRVRRDGEPVAMPTAPAVWGEPGTNAQHAYFQWLHQGTDVVPVEFIVPVNPSGGDAARHRLLVANALAQAQALMTGKSEAAVAAELEAAGTSRELAAVQAPHRAFPGNRPSTTLLLPAVDAFCLGQLIALYEHRTFVEALMWGINPFDQFGVELGKRLTGPIVAALEGRGPPEAIDPSTCGLIARVRAMQRPG